MTICVEDAWRQETPDWSARDRRKGPDEKVEIEPGTPVRRPDHRGRDVEVAEATLLPSPVGELRIDSQSGPDRRKGGLHDRIDHGVPSRRLAGRENGGPQRLGRQHRLYRVPRDRAVLSLDRAELGLDDIDSAFSQCLQVVNEGSPVSVESVACRKHRKPLARERRIRRRPAEDQRDLAAAEDQEPRLVGLVERRLDLRVQPLQLVFGESAGYPVHPSAWRTAPMISSASLSLRIRGGLNCVTE